MSVTIENIAPYIGQSVLDIYVRKVGVLVSVYSDVEGNVSAIEVMINDTTYDTISGERLVKDVDGLKIMPEWLVNVRKLERRLDILKKRIKATEELYKKGQIPVHAYQELKERFSKEIEKAKSEVKSARDALRKRLYEIENFVVHIEKAMTHLMVSYTAGEIAESGFKISADFMRFARQAALDEKKDIDKHMAMLEKLEQELQAVLSSNEEAKVAETMPTASTAQQPIAVKVVS